MPAANLFDTRLWADEILRSYKTNLILAGLGDKVRPDKDVETLAGVYWDIIHDPKIKCPPGCRNNHHDVECPKRAASEAVIELEKRMWHIKPRPGTTSAGPR